MGRYKTAEWKELVDIQNTYYPDQDILTITGFMDNEEFLKHVSDYRELVKNK